MYNHFCREKTNLILIIDSKIILKGHLNVESFNYGPIFVQLPKLTNSIKFIHEKGSVRLFTFNQQKAAN